MQAEEIVINESLFLLATVEIIAIQISLRKGKGTTF